MQPKRQRNYDNPAYDPLTACEHTSDLTFTRHPCSCGRTYWPPVGRGRGESLSSPRRIAAKYRANQVLRMRMHGATYETIGRRLGLSKSGAWRAYWRAIQSTWR